jgi:hypothetical protein
MRTAADLCRDSIPQLFALHGEPVLDALEIVNRNRARQGLPPIPRRKREGSE